MSNEFTVKAARTILREKWGHGDTAGPRLLAKIEAYTLGDETAFETIARLAEIEVDDMRRGRLTDSDAVTLLGRIDMADRADAVGAKAKLAGIIEAMLELVESGGMENWAQEDLLHCVRQLELVRTDLKKAGIRA